MNYIEYITGLQRKEVLSHEEAKMLYQITYNMILLWETVEENEKKLNKVFELGVLLKNTLNKFEEIKCDDDLAESLCVLGDYIEETRKYETKRKINDLRSQLNICDGLDNIYQQSSLAQEIEGGTPYVRIDDAISDTISELFKKNNLKYDVLDYLGGSGLFDAISKVRRCIKKQLKEMGEDVE